MLMSSRSARRAALGAAMAACVLAPGPAAQAQDFLSTLFGGFGGHRPQAPAMPLPFANDGAAAASPFDLRSRAGGNADKRHASMNFSPASKSVLARFQHVPVVASE